LKCLCDESTRGETSLSPFSYISWYDHSSADPIPLDHSLDPIPVDHSLDPYTNLPENTYPRESHFPESHCIAQSIAILFYEKGKNSIVITLELVVAAHFHLESQMVEGSEKLFERYTKKLQCWKVFLIFNYRI
jgi:hypothetical protein